MNNDPTTLIENTTSLHHGGVLHSLRSAVARANLQATGTPYPPDRNLIPIADWRREYIKLFSANGTRAMQRRFDRARTFLNKRGYTRELGDKVYLTQR